MNFVRTYKLLQIALQLSLIVVSFNFVVADVYWFYYLTDAERWNSLCRNRWDYDVIWYLDVFTYVFLYLWLATELLKAGYYAKQTYQTIRGFVLSKIIPVIKPLLTFDMLFDVIFIVITFAVIKHAFGRSLSIPQLLIISDVRPMANIWYDIQGVLEWLCRLIW
jgi:hypothetical protein